MASAGICVRIHRKINVQAAITSGQGAENKEVSLANNKVNEAMELVIPTFRYLAVTILLFALSVLASFLFIKPHQKGIDPAIYVDAYKDQQPVTAVVSRRTGRALKLNIIVAVQTPAMLINLFPTFMELAGLTLPADRTIDGSSLWSILSGGADNLKDRPLYFFHDFDLEAVRQGDWKYYENLSTYTWPMPLNKMTR